MAELRSGAGADDRDRQRPLDRVDAVARAERLRARALLGGQRPGEERQVLREREQHRPVDRRAP